MVLDLGFISYEECYKIQKEMVIRRKLNEIDDTLILAEHASVFTIGRSGHREHLKVGEDFLLRKGVRVLDVDRGGDITYHGPGQLVLYPIINLKGRCPDLHKYMRDLEEVAINFLNRYSVKAERHSAGTGAWVADKKIASIGIGVSNWVTYHGLSINIKTDLEFFNMIYACGLKDVSMGSLEALIGRSVDLPEAKDHIIQVFDAVFNSGKIHFAYDPHNGGAI